MGILLIFVGIVCGTILFLIILAFILYLAMKAKLRKMGYTMSEIKEMFRESEYNAKYKTKSISGLTAIKLPVIKKDFPEFSESAFYSKVETSLNGIFNSITDKDIKSIKELNVIKHSLQESIDQMKKDLRDISITNVKFHKHTIKDYQNISGAAMITIGSSLSYNYEEVKNNKVIVDFKGIPKQTSYTSKFVYIYDEDKFKDNANTFGVHCPNCGAPVKSFGSKKVCEYCHSGYKDINLKAWFISEYKEDER